MYSAANRPTKADLAQIIERLTQRVETAEARIEQKKATSAIQAEANTNVTTENSTSGAMTAMPLEMPTPNLSDLSPYFRSSSAALPCRVTPTTPQPECWDMDLFNTIVPGGNFGARGSSNNSHFAAAGADCEAPADRQSARSLPSLSEIRAHNSMFSPGLSMQGQLTGSGSSIATGSGGAEDARRRTREELRVYANATSKAFVELAGISSAVAEYLAWLRQSAVLAHQLPGGLEFSSVVETLESRMKELHDLAGSKSRTAWRRLTESMDQLGVNLSTLQSEIDKRSSEQSIWFQTSYDIARPLDQQLHLELWNTE